MALEKSLVRYATFAAVALSVGACATQSETRQARTPGAVDRTSPAQVAARGDDNLILASRTLSSRVEVAANGCWVRFYDNTNFNGRSFTVLGPKAVPDLSTYISGVDSAVVGPNARVTGYSNQNYLEQTLTLQPGQQIANLPAMGFKQDLESLKLNC